MVMNKTKIALIIIATALLMGGGVFAYSSMNNDQKVDRTPTKNESENQEIPTVTDTEEKEQDIPDKTPVQYSPPAENSNNNQTSSLTGVITSKSVKGNDLVIRTNINGTLSGTCKLLLTRKSDNKQISRSAELAQNPSSSSCKGFDVATSQLGSGNWDILITVTSNGKSGEIKGKVSL